MLVAMANASESRAALAVVVSGKDLSWLVENCMLQAKEVSSVMSVT